MTPDTHGQDAVIHSIVTAIGYVFASADYDTIGGPQHLPKITKWIPMLEQNQRTKHRKIRPHQLNSMMIRTMLQFPTLATTITTSRSVISHITDTAIGSVDVTADTSGSTIKGFESIEGLFFL